MTDDQSTMSRVSRVVSGGLGALFCALIFGALTVFGVINMTLGHVLMSCAWIVGSLLIVTEVIPGKRSRHKVISVCGLAIVLFFGDRAIVVYVKSHERPEAGQVPIATPTTKLEEQPNPRQSSLPPKSPSPAPDALLHPQPVNMSAFLFKDSPLFTPQRKRVIAKYFLDFRAYLTGLGIDVPKEFPPIGIETDKTMAPHFSYSSGPSYHDTIWMKFNQLDNPRMITQNYSGYVFSTILLKPMIPKFQAQQRGQPPNAEIQKEDHYGWYAELAIFQYFTWSFWNKRDKEETVCPYHQSMLPVSYLWAIRERYGKSFTDRLVAYTTKELTDNPAIGPTERFPDWFVRAVTNANFVVDNKAEKMPAIRNILNQCEWLSGEGASQKN